MRVLLITDRSRAEAIRSPLADEGFAVEVCEQADRADYRVLTTPPDVIVLDRSHLRGQSYSCLLRWRRSGVKAHILLLLPRGCDATERANGLDAGADACLNHPIQIEELLAHLRALRRRDRLPPSPLKRVHDMEINTAVRTVTRSGQPIHLTPREFDLLQLLAYHQGRVVTRAQIHEHLYQNPDGGNSNVVDVYIRYLRNKVDKGFAKPLILTRWGEGYLLRAEEAG
jgi:DNA-binding response OmpR family regulator